LGDNILTKRLKLFFAMILAGATTAHAAWPDKPIQMIVPYPPGGFTDSLARAVAKPLSERLGQQVIVQNISGGGGNIGAAKAAKSPADGYTIFVGNNATITINTLIYKSLPFDPLKDFMPVSLIGGSRAALVVTPSLNVTSIAALVALAKSRPGELNFGSSGTGGVSHLAGELFNVDNNIRMTHIPYKGTAPATADLLGGQLQVMFNDVAIPYIISGKLRALAISGTSRSKQVPDVPTFSELGIKGFDTYAWFAVFVPAGTPEEIVLRLNRELTGITTDPALQLWAESQNGDMMSSTPQGLAQFIQNDLKKWKSVVDQTGVTAE
jgi:tripartite-type tricarboxylate transporter receptor subunit TctC